jgi:hypothetical protein
MKKLTFTVIALALSATAVAMAQQATNAAAPAAADPAIRDSLAAALKKDAAPPPAGLLGRDAPGSGSPIGGALLGAAPGTGAAKSLVPAK